MQTNTIKVLVMISTYRLGGPGKGILQYLKGPEAKIDFTLSTFNMQEPEKCDFLNAATAANIDTKLFGQANKYNPQTFKEVINFIKSNDIDIIQTHEYKSHLVGLICSIFTKAKWITWAHGYTSENIKVKAYNLLDKSLHFFSHHAIGVSPKLVRTLKKIRFLGHPSSLILNAVDPDEIKSNDKVTALELRNKFSNKDDFLISIYGRLSPEKGQDIAIQAFSKTLKKHNNLKLLIIGEGPESDKLNLLIEDLKLKDHVSFTPYQSHLKEYFEASDLTLLPSRSEGLPNVVIESMSLGTPVLATVVGGVPEIISDKINGWTCPPENIEAMSQSILTIVKNSKEYNKVKGLCKESIFPKFSIKLRKKAIFDLYNKVI